MYDYSKPSSIHFLGVGCRSTNHCSVWLDSVTPPHDDTQPVPILSFPPWRLRETFLCCYRIFQWPRFCGSFIHSLLRFPLPARSFLQVMISPFYFPVNAQTFNFVSGKFAAAPDNSPTQDLLPAGVCHIRCSNYFRHSMLVLHTRGQVVAQRTHCSGHGSGRSAGR